MSTNTFIEPETFSLVAVFANGHVISRCKGPDIETARSRIPDWKSDFPDAAEIRLVGVGRVIEVHKN